MAQLQLLKSFKRYSIIALSTFGVLGWLAPSTAQAFDFSVIGTANSSNYSVTPAPAVIAGSAGFGLGVTLGFDLVPFFSLETGALFVTHGLTETIGTTNVSLSYNFIQIPLLLRFTPIHFIALEAGGYYGAPVSSSFTGTIPSVLLSSPTSTYSSASDFGLLLGAGLRFPLLPLMSLRVDALYELGLKNLSAGTTTQYSRNLDIWVGVMMSLM